MGRRHGRVGDSAYSSGGAKKTGDVRRFMLASYAAAGRKEKQCYIAWLFAEANVDRDDPPL